MPEPNDPMIGRVEMMATLVRGQEIEAALQDTVERLHAILHSAVEGIITIDEHGIIQSVNPAAEKMFGYSGAEMVGKNVKLIIPSPHRESHCAFIRNYLRTGEAKVIGIGRKVSGVCKDGRIFPLELSVAEVKLSSGRIFTGFVRDVTKRQEAEEALRRSEANLALAQQIAHVGSYELGSPNPDRLHWSDEIYRIVGLERTTGQLTLEQYISQIIHADDQARVRVAVQRSITKRTRLDLEYRIRRPDGSQRNVHSIAEPVLDESGKVRKLVGTLQDITERKGLEREILEISEREQRRIGQDLHDSLCQHLAGIEFRLHALQQKLETKFKAAANDAAGLARLVQAGIEQTRALARGLSPVLLPPESLMGALQELALATEKNFSISCAFNCLSPVLIRDNTMATHLYRIAQEAVHNAVRHGKAKFIVINLFRANGRVILGVKDDGFGIRQIARAHKGMGLRIMQHRASMVGGTLVVQREPEGGTSVICSVEAAEEREPKP